MSQWTSVELEMNDGECIVAALKEMGFLPEVHDTAQSIEGYGGFRSRDQLKTANIIVRKKQIEGISWADLGFRKNDNGAYTMVSDLKHSGQKLTGQLKQLYGKHRVVKQVRRLGYSVTSQKVDKEGRIKIRVAAP